MRDAVYHLHMQLSQVLRLRGDLCIFSKELAQEHYLGGHLHGWDIL